MYGAARFTFSLRRAGAVAGVGLFAEARIRKRAVLGVFTGQAVSRAVALERRARGAKCIVQFERDGKRVYLDGSRGKASCFCWLNSCRNSGREAIVEFVCLVARFVPEPLALLLHATTRLGPELYAQNPDVPPHPAGPRRPRRLPHSWPVMRMSDAVTPAAVARLSSSALCTSLLKPAAGWLGSTRRTSTTAAG